MIRAPLPADLPDLCRLFGQLGYTQSEDGLRRRLHQTLADPACIMRVHQGANRVVDGVIVMHLMRPLHEPHDWALISSLVVDEAVRGGGVGAQLLAETELLASLAGCARVMLASNETREDAHRFYERHGYQERRKRFVKMLTPTPMDKKRPA